MSEARRKVRIFFSWQSDLPQAATTRAIRTALRAAAGELEAEQPVDFSIEEATSNTPGSPYIPWALAEKIRQADIFVSDITTVARIDNGKSMPNANVTFELGVAAAHIGWSRIIMFFNEALAPLEHLPFDFDRHRISVYAMAEGKEKENAGALRRLARDALASIVRDDPKRPRELEGIEPGKVRRDRDIENIKWFMRQLSTAALDQHIEESPGYVRFRTAVMLDGIHEIMAKSAFSIYDSDVLAEMTGLRDSLRTTLAYGHLYHDTANMNLQAFGRGDFMETDEEREAWKVINAARGDLAKHFQALLALIRERYLEVDIDATNAEFEAAMKLIDERSH
jgi:hypothetical protein